MRVDNPLTYPFNPSAVGGNLKDGTTVVYAAGIVPIHVEFGTKVDKVIALLEITYSRPSRSLWMEVETADFASRTCDALNGRVKHGITLSCALRDSRSVGIHTIKISNITEDFTYDDILTMLPSHLRNPNKFWADDLSYDPLTRVSELIKEEIGDSAIGTRGACMALESPNKRKRKLLFQFEGSLDLSGLVRTLDNKKLRELGDTKIHAVGYLKANLSVDRGLYDQGVAKLRLRREKIEREHGVSLGLWDDFGRSSSTQMWIISHKMTLESLMSVRKILNEVLFPTYWLRCLPKIPTPALQTHRVLLPKAEMTPAEEVNFSHAQKTFGSNIVLLDKDSDTPAIIVHGSMIMLRKVQNMLFPDDQVEVECRICMDEIEEAVTIDGCGHVWCKACFKNHCTIKRESQFPMKCPDANCDSLIPMQLLLTYLEDAELQGVLTRSVQLYFRRHPDRYAPCPNPKCTHYWGVDKSMNEHVCAACFTIICTGCRTEQHFGQTCNENLRQLREHKRELEAWISKEGAKRCPVCKTIMQKTEGCNHMRCPGCEAHICWVCMKVFPTDIQTYRHMADQHTNFGDPEVLGLQHEVDQLQAAGIL